MRNYVTNPMEEKGYKGLVISRSSLTIPKRGHA